MSNRQLTRRDFLKEASQATAAALACSGAITLASTPAEHADEAAAPCKSRISYFCNGEIHVNVPGKPEGKPLTTGHMDFKPSWSKTGDMLVCFRRLKDDPVTVKWKTAIFIINVDGTGFHLLSDGQHTDFNPTWTRDGKNTPLWNRKNEKNDGFQVMQSKVGGQPGEEAAITDERFHNWAHSCLGDGRILVNAAHPTLGWGVFLLTRRPDKPPLYQQVQWELNDQGELHRASISPSEKKIRFEFLKGHTYREPGHALYIADFDAQQRAITNLKLIANQESKPYWYAYPRWLPDESAVVYHLNSTGNGQLYIYQLADGSTRRVSTNPAADYRYPHGEAAPC